MEKLVIRRFFIYTIQLCKYICFVYRLFLVNKYIENDSFKINGFSFSDINTDQISQNLPFLILDSL